MKRQDLAQAIEDVCHFGGQTHHNWDTKAHKVLNIILETIVNRCKRHGRCHIPGFGIFYIHTRKAHYRPIAEIVKGKMMTGKQKPILLPTKRFVKWRPTEEFEAVLKEVLTDGYQDNN